MSIYHRGSNTPLAGPVALVAASCIFTELLPENTPCCNFPSFGQFIMFIISDIFFSCAVSLDIAVGLEPLIEGSLSLVAIERIRCTVWRDVWREMRRGI